MSPREAMVACLVLGGLAHASGACGDGDQSATSGDTVTSTGAQGGESGAGGGVGGAGAGAAGGSGGEGEAAGLPWDDCPLFTGGTGNEADCVTVAMPAVYDDPSQGTVNVFLKRLPAAGARRGSLWLLSGGPSQSGVVWEALAPLLQTSLPDLDIVMPDHRGTGRSDRLGCPDAEAVGSEDGPFITLDELPDCLTHLQATWGDKLSAFNGTAAARDIGELIALAGQPGDETFVYGVSYGSQWAHRYLQQFPDQAAGVSADAICIPNCSFTELDAWYDATAQELLTRCEADAFCGGKLGASSHAKGLAAIAALGTPGGCLGLDPRLDAAAIKNLLARLLYGASDRMFVPAIVYRLDRCSAADVNALNHLAAFVFEPVQEPLPATLTNDSPLLGINVAVVDNMPTAPPDAATLSTALDGYLAATGASVTYRELLDTWPLYPKDGHFGALASSTRPILLTHGTLDFIPVTAVQPAADHFSGANQSAVFINGAPHGTLFQSPTSPSGDCSGRMLVSFAKDPSGPIDDACLATPVPLDFVPDAAASATLMGTSDAYDGDPGPVAMAALTRDPQPMTPALWRLLRRLRERWHP